MPVKKNLDHHGFAMVEAMVVVMIFMILASTLYGISGIKHQMTIRRVQEDEAYYAALTAVRLMAEEINNGQCGDMISNGMESFETEISFIPDDADKEAVSVPVEICTERSGEDLLLTAKARDGKKEKRVTLLLHLDSGTGQAVIHETADKIADATMSDAYEDRWWVPVHYKIEE